MKKRITVVIALAAVALGLGTFVLADVKNTKAGKVQAAELVALLPASDGVVTFDVKRFFNDALPTLLSKNQPMLAEITGKIEEFASKTGVDIRQFDHVAVGVTAKKREGTRNYDYDPVAIARGDVNSGALIGAAKLAANGKYHEERVGEKTVYIFEAKKIAADQNKKAGNKAPAKVVDRISSEVAVTAIDSNTLAFGDPARVRQTLEAKTHVGSDILALLAGTSSPVMTFASRVPPGMESLVPLDNDELGKSIASIRYLFGNVDVAAGNASVHATARTVQPANARSLHETLEGLQLLGKALLGSAKGEDKQVYARMIENAKFTTKGTDVIFDLSVPQSDIDILVGYLKK